MSTKPFTWDGSKDTEYLAEQMLDIMRTRKTAHIGSFGTGGPHGVIFYRNRRPQIVDLRCDPAEMEAAKRALYSILQNTGGVAFAAIDTYWVADFGEDTKPQDAWNHPSRRKALLAEAVAVDKPRVVLEQSFHETNGKVVFEDIKDCPWHPGMWTAGIWDLDSAATIGGEA